MAIARFGEGIPCGLGDEQIKEAANRNHALFPLTIIIRFDWNHKAL